MLLPYLTHRRLVQHEVLLREGKRASTYLCERLSQNFVGSITRIFLYSTNVAWLGYPRDRQTIDVSICIAQIDTGLAQMLLRLGYIWQVSVILLFVRFLQFFLWKVERTRMIAALERAIKGQCIYVFVKHDRCLSLLDRRGLDAVTLYLILWSGFLSNHDGGYLSSIVVLHVRFHFLWEWGWGPQ